MTDTPTPGFRAEERATLVRWLRDAANDEWGMPIGSPFALLARLADAVERGDLERDERAREQAPSQDADSLLAAFQRACEMVVVDGDSHISETTKERAVHRNELRQRLIDLATLRTQLSTAEERIRLLDRTIANMRVLAGLPIPPEIGETIQSLRSQLATAEARVRESTELARRLADDLVAAKNEGFALAGRVRRVEGLERAFDTLVKAADDAFRHWDRDEDSKVGKILASMSGHNRCYRLDVDQAIAERRGRSVCSRDTDGDA